LRESENFCLATVKFADVTAMNVQCTVHCTVHSTAYIDCVIQKKITKEEADTNLIVGVCMQSIGIHKYIIYLPTF